MNSVCPAVARGRRRLGLRRPGTLEMLGKTVAAIESALQATAPGADGLTFLPFLNGERTPDLPHARGSLVGISANNFSADHLIRAAVELNRS